MKSHLNSQITASVALAILFWVTAAIAQLAGPQPFDLTWHTIDSGGGKSTGGGFELTGTIGQPDASSVALAGGTFSLSGGFWPGASSPAPNPCPADISPPGGNGGVNVDDLLFVINHWGACPAPCPPHGGCPADIAPAPNGNCAVNVDDLLAVISAWGSCP